MGIFLISLGIVFFISICFYKKRIWEYRYLILLISSGVTLTSYVTINYVQRNKLPIKEVVVNEYKLNPIFATDSIFNDSSSYITTKTPNSCDIKYDFNDDTTIIKRKVPIVLYGDGKLEKIGYNTSNKNKIFFYKLNNVYFQPTSKGIFYKKIKYVYVRNSKWISSLNLPPVKTITCFYLPENIYKNIPDSLKKELPKFN